MPARSWPQPRRGWGRSARPAPKPKPPTYPAFLPVVVPRPDGGLCLGEERRRYESESTAIWVNERQDQRWLRFANQYDFCPGVARPGDSSPAGQATDWWRQSGEDLLATPQPRIAPGWMLAGKAGHLEANVALADSFRHDTPLGPLTIDVVGELYVDWGDGHDDGPFDHAGGPWPDGTITHTWTHAGRYDVVVTVVWRATWRLGGSSGELGDLATDGVIEDFQIRGLEAVRNR